MSCRFCDVLCRYYLKFTPTHDVADVVACNCGEKIQNSVFYYADDIIIQIGILHAFDSYLLFDWH